jgi:SAM-dependent methyltransferase
VTDSAVSARTAYDALAPHYDFFTAGHDHAAWTASLEALIDRRGAPPGRLLDVACGSGNSFLPALRRGWSVTACDVSPAMVAEAARKAPAVPLSVQDMRRLPVLGRFDVVWCLDDALNYLLDPAELVAAFAGMRRNLAPGSALLFDLNTLATYRGFFASDVVAAGEDRLVVWQGRTASDATPGCLAEAAVTTFARERATGEWTRTVAVHRQRHHPQETVVRALAEAGLEPPAVFGHGLDGVPTPGADELRDTKVVYLTRPARRRARGKEVSRSDPHRAPRTSRGVGGVRPEGQLTATAGGAA